VRPKQAIYLPNFVTRRRRRRRKDLDDRYHSLPSSAEVKNAWSCTYTLPYVFVVQYLVKHRGNYNIL